MGLFDSLVQKIVQPAVQKKVSQLTSSLPLSEKTGEALKSLTGQISQNTGIGEGLKEMFSDDPNSGLIDTKIAPWLKQTFTDDPNSGWYDQYKMRSAQDDYEAQQAEQLANLRSGENSYQFPQPGKTSAPSTGGSWTDKLGNILTGGSGAGLAVGANLLGGLGGYLGSKSDYEAAENTQRQAADLAGAYETLGPSQAASVADNENMVALRAKALQGLQQRADMGLTPEDQAELNKIRNQTNAQFQSRQAGIQEDMNRRGVGNSGMNLAAQLSNNQAQTQNASNLADTQAEMSFKAKQDALKNLGSASSTALQEDFNRDITRAQNADAVSRFNTANKMSSQQNKAQAVQNIATTQAQAAARKAQMIKDAGQTIGSGVTAYNQSIPKTVAK